jgi:Penicillin-Binding Protein C-terminus Family
MSTEGATPLVRAAYTAIAARYGEPTAPPRPAAIVSAEVCPLSGKRSGPHCEHRKRELFLAGHVPDATCDWHQQVCGVSAVVYPPSLRAWTKFYGRPSPPVCSAPSIGPLAITAPVDGAHFVLEAHRPARDQRPPLAAVPAAPDLRWTIDGQPADAWIPTPGRHRVAVARGPRSAAATAAVDITYE